MGKTIMYERIYADLLAKIQNGDYQPGDRLPSEKESAELYGVSRITAKKAMDMLAKEKKISREPGRGSFVCSPAAAVEMKKESRGTANQRIGVIFDGFGSDFGTRLLQGIESECDRRQSDLLFKCTYGSIEKEKQAIDAAIRAGVKGILLLCAQGDNYNSKVLELALNGYPLVLMDRRMQGISIPCVRTDNYEAANEVTKILIAMGHKKICFLTHALRRQRSMSATKDLPIVCSNMKTPMGHLQNLKNITTFQRILKKNAGNLIMRRLQRSWKKTGNVRHILPLNTGSGCFFRNI